MRRPDGTSFHTADGTPYGEVNFTVTVAPPQLVEEEPASGTTTTLNPTLYARATDADDAASTLQYNFTLCSDAALTANCVNSGWTSSQTYTLPPGTVSWGATNYWRVSVRDPKGNVTTASGLVLNTVVPQPATTNRLAAQPDALDGRGVEPTQRQLLASSPTDGDAGRSRP